MSAPIQRKWSGQVASTGNLNSTTHGSGTTAQRNAASPWPVDRPWLDTSLKAWFYNNGVEATPVWIQNSPEIVTSWPTSPTLGQWVFNTSTNQQGICTSTDPVVFSMGGQPVYVKDEFTSYANDTAFDNQYPTDNATDLNADSTGNQIDWIGDCGSNTAGWMGHYIGSTPSKKVLRFKMDVDTRTQGAASASSFFAIGLANSPDYQRTDEITAFFLLLEVDSGATNMKTAWDIWSTSFGVLSPSHESTISSALVVDEYYVEMAFNDNIITVKAFTDTGFTSQFGSTVTINFEPTATHTSADIDFNTLVMMVSEQNTGDSTLRGTVDWWEIYYGVSSV